MVNVKIYVEGGGDTRELKAKCRMGFSSFFQKVGLAGRMPRVISCGSRQRTYDRFHTAFSNATETDFIIFLVDSEGPVAVDSGAWSHLKTRDNWDRPDGATDENAHLMVQCMEAWFLADKNALANFYGKGFNENSLPRRIEIEHVPKSDIEEGLKMATRPCTKGRYDKGSHSFAILAELNPEKVIAASPHAERLVETMQDKASAQ